MVGKSWLWWWQTLNLRKYVQLNLSGATAPQGGRSSQVVSDGWMMDGWMDGYLIYYRRTALV